MSLCCPSLLHNSPPSVFGIFSSVVGNDELNTVTLPLLCSQLKQLLYKSVFKQTINNQAIYTHLNRSMSKYITYSSKINSCCYSVIWRFFCKVVISKNLLNSINMQTWTLCMRSLMGRCMSRYGLESEEALLTCYKLEHVYTESSLLNVLFKLHK